MLKRIVGISLVFFAIIAVIACGVADENLPASNSGCSIESKPNSDANVSETIPVSLETKKYFGDVGIRVEIAYIAVYDNIVDIHFIIEDMIGGQFGEEVQLHYSLIHQGFGLGLTSDQSSGIVQKGDGSLFEIHSRTVFRNPIESGELTLEIHFIVSSHTLIQDVIAIDFDELQPQTPYSFIEGIPILRPNLQDIEIGFCRYDDESQGLSLSSIGVIDERIHIQELRRALPQDSFIAAAFKQFKVISPNGEVVRPISDGVRFKINESGEIEEISDLFAMTLFYDEYIENIFDVDKERIAEYNLVANLQVINWINLDWEIVFDVFDLIS